jgi:hypothetical protein
VLGQVVANGIADNTLNISVPNAGKYILSIDKKSYIINVK